MNISMVSPKTESGFKRLANRLKKQDGITHLQALDKAASIAGYSNFRHAKNQLSVKAPASPQQPLGIYITAYWAGVESGRETLFVEYLPHWPKLLTRSELSRCRAVSYFRGEAPDHLVAKHVLERQDQAIEKVCHAARELQFMHATGLQIVTGVHCSVANPSKNRPDIPDADHTSLWRTATGITVGLDEPYRLISQSLGLRSQWANDNGMVIEPIPASVYHPDLISEMYLIGDDASELKLLSKKISSYPHGAISAGRWREQSRDFRPLFTSPLQQAEARRPRAPVKYSLRRSTSTTIPMRESERRPNGKMPIASHKDLAKRLNEIQALAAARYGIRGHIGRVKNALDGWVEREYKTTELPHDELEAMYFVGRSLPLGSKYLTQIQWNLVEKNISHIRDTLSTQYPDCAPLREVLRRLDFVSKSLNSWQSVG